MVISDGVDACYENRELTEPLLRSFSIPGRKIPPFDWQFQDVLLLSGLWLSITGSVNIRRGPN